MCYIYSSLLKRVFDVFFALFILTLMSPLLFILLLFIILIDGDPIFIQKRVGKRSRIFYLYKFKTMSDKKDIKGRLLPDDQRITSFGKLLRLSSLDEIPQLINVIKGDMSLIGPRPLLVEYLPLYTKEQARRHEMRPGITGWAQVNGRNAISWQQKFEYDVWYVDNISFLLDMKIIFLTLKKVIKRSDINSATSATMEKFKGNN